MSAEGAGHVTVAASPATGLFARFGRLDGLTKAILVIASLGFLVAGYLVYVHYYGLGALVCLGGGHHGESSCATVQSSVYSKLAGIPVADLGFAGYIVILASLRVRGEIGRLIGFATAFIGFGFSGYLTYREIFTIKAICEWCVSSAVMMTILAILTAIRYFRADPAS
jgi:uncharacterized membrane protein